MADPSGIADDIFCFLVGDGSRPSYIFESGEEIRSAGHSDTVDVLLDGQWHRISITPISEPISEEENCG
jgi:hypothetical protein